MDRPEEIRFDGWTLVRPSGELVREGRRIRLQGQPLQILEELLARPGELVTREQLVAKLWPTQVVDYDTALNAAVRRLRAALGDEAETPRFIETIPRRGYRFIRAVGPHSAGAIDPPVTWRARVPRLAAVALLVLAAGGVAFWLTRDTPGAGVSRPGSDAVPASIVVLPFVDLSTGQNQQHLADGLTEELIDLLAQAGGLRVTARTSSFAFKGAKQDIATVAKRLNVNHILDGSIRAADEQVHITARLVDVESGSQRWSRTYDRKLEDIFDVQRDIAASVNGALSIAAGEVTATDQPASAKAYEQLLRARLFFQRRAPGDMELARQYYERALEIDPDYARAWAGIASVYWIQTTDSAIPHEAGLARLREAAERALALDPRLAEAHFRLANYAWAIGDVDSSRDHRRLAAELDPGSPLALGYSAATAMKLGRYDDAVAITRRAVELDPLATVFRYNLASYLLTAGRLDEAHSEMRQVLELNPAHRADVAAHALILQGRHVEALEMVEQWPESAERAQCLALALHGLGRQADAETALKSLIDEYGASDPFKIAVVRAYRDETDDAFHWLEAAVEHCRSEGRLRAGCVGWTMSVSPYLKPLHADPRWQARAADLD